MTLNIIRKVILIISFTLLTACAGTYRAYLDSLSYALSAKPDATLNFEQVNASTSDLLYVRYGERPQAVMALAFIERGQHKWISADNILLVVEDGRVIRTAGFKNDLLYTTDSVLDPLKTLPSVLAPTKWTRLVDWRKGEYGYQISSEFRSVGQQTLRFFESDINTAVFEEYLEYPNQANFAGVKTLWRNTYWFDSATGVLLKSRQQLSPQAEPIEMTYISRIGRLLEARNL